MKKSLVFITMAVAVLAGCGGGGSASKLASDDVAVVGKQHISRADMDEVLARAKKSYKRQGVSFPAQGTTQFQTLRNQVVTLLVQQAEFDQKAASMGVKVTPAEIEQRLTFIKKQDYGGSEKRYLADIKKQGYTDAQVRSEVIKTQLLSEKVRAQILKDIKVSDSDVHGYYTSHISSYAQPATRDVRYILVGKSKPLAESVYQQLKAGNDQTWCTLAKKYAKDASGQNCGKATFTKGQTVKVFDTAAFTTPTRQIAKPFFDPTQYKAWFVMEPLGPVKKAATTPEKQVAPVIKQTLLADRQKQAVTAWSNKLTKSYCGDTKVRYQVGYAPNPDPCAQTTTTNATTTG
ncbi:MAG TPA: SurA N-terminal domain-containing protein [Gaiellaceae bacterium]|jgi:hypothetical protein